MGVAAAGQVQVISSQLTLLETLVSPIREGVAELEAAFRAFLLESREFRLVPIDIGILEAAARIRAEAGLATPDAIHAATAFGLNADMLVTNDVSFLRFKGVPVSVLSQVLAAEP